MIRPKILIVDDEMGFVLDLQFRLKKHNYEDLTTANSSEEAIEKSSKQIFDLILMDINLKSEIDGIETATIIKSKYDVPVIYLTSFTEDEILQKAKSSDPYGYILKPYNETQLITTVEIAFKKHIVEKKLKESEERLNLAISGSEYGLFDIDFGKEKAYFSPQWKQILGYDFSEQKDILTLWHSKIHPKDQDIVNKYLKNHFEGKSESFEVEYKIKSENGDWKWILAKGKIVSRDEQNKPLRFIGTIKDISERRQSEEALRISEEKFRTLVQSFDDIIFTVDTNQRFTGFYGRAFEIANMPIELYFGKTPKEIFDEDIAEIHIKSYKKALTGEYVLYEWYYKNHVSEKFYLSSLSPMFDSNGTIIGLVGVSRDISDSKKVEIENRKLSQAVEQSPVTILITDTKGNIEYVNNKFEEVTGYRFEEVIGKNPNLLKSGEKSSDEYRELWISISNGKEWRGEFHNKKKNGELFWESALISPITNSKGEITHYISIKEDITDRKEIEQMLIKAKEDAERSEKLKSEFLAQMSHEIRQPLNVILNFSSIIKEEFSDKLDEDSKSTFKVINKSANRIVRTVDLILNMAEIQTGTYTAIKKSIDLYEDILQKLYLSRKREAKEKQLNFALNNSARNTVAIADEYSVNQIFDNIIDNALKYTNSGEILINLLNDEKNNIVVEVKDTGIGISKDYINKIFDPFSQEEQGYARKYEGNGLGLALVKKYCELNDAKILIESEKERGTVFKVVFNS